METVMVTLKHAKAKKLLMDLEEMDLIKVTEDAYPLIRSAIAQPSDLKNQIITPMSEEEIDGQLKEM